MSEFIAWSLVIALSIANRDLAMQLRRAEVLRDSALKFYNDIIKDKQ